MKKLIAPFFSMVTTGILLLVFSFSIAWATFIENDYGTDTARILVYNALWFEMLLFLLAGNLTGSIIYNKLISKKRWEVFVFHSGFLVILTGAAVTRYTGLEGSMHIREGQQSNQVLTGSTHISITAFKGTDTAAVVEEVRFSPYTSNRFKKSLEISGSKVTVENLKFVPSAAETVTEDPSGEPVVAMLALDRENKRFDFHLKRNDSKVVGDMVFRFMPSPDSSGICITLSDDRLFFRYSDTVYVTGMEQSETEKLEPGIDHPLKGRIIYKAGDLGFVLKQYLPKGKPGLIYVPSHAGTLTNDAVHTAVTVSGQTRELFVYGKRGLPGNKENVVIEGIHVGVSYGSVVHMLPFVLRLNDFQIERYPGSNTPSSFASEVILTDRLNRVEKSFRIFMNNILKYKGYRFFQSSFDEDEKGTVLSVNYDWAGTTITYAGYFIMAVGMVLTLFSRHSRFTRLARASAGLSRKRKKLFSFLLLSGFFFSGFQVDSQNRQQVVSSDHAGKFGTLQVQNIEGRIEPVNTLASEVLRKVAKKGSYEGLNPVQVMLEIMAEPEKWRNAEIIRVADTELRKVLGARNNYVSFINILSADGQNYRLRDYVEEAYGKEPARRSRFDKEVINVDERVNILYKLFTGDFLTIFPVPDDESRKWLSPSEAAKSTLPEVSAFSEKTFGNYLTALVIARQTGNYGDAERFLLQLKENQKETGAEIYPAGLKSGLEVFYINFNIFSKLSKLYVILGLAMLILQFINLLTAGTWTKRTGRAGFWLVCILFSIHTAGLAIRWYISGHAPWSNGYETLIYISWSTCLAGLIFARRSPMTLAVTTILSAISLFVAGMSWMSPELTNLVPVLKSYWLVIHVAVITASYAFFALAALLGLVILILIIILSNGNNEKISFTIKEMELIIEMAVIVGLFMLTTGSFLGGVWANESWGRYWGWDPKETWALVTILVYAFIAHMHNIPGFRGAYAVSLASLVGFASVLMTFFGVNYYLSGLHSYAQGEPVPIPAGVYAGVFVVALLSLTAFFALKRKPEVR